MKSTHALGGHAHFWRVACALTQQSGEKAFTAHDIIQRSNGATAKVVSSWIGRMLRLKAIVCVDMAEVRGATGARKRKAYRVVAPSRTPPRDPASLRGLPRQYLWTAMRTLGTFTVAELAVAASTDEVAIGEKTAGNWVRELAAADVLRLAGVNKRNGGAEKVWRLRPSANTGPTPPRVATRGRRIEQAEAVS
ncbi:MAG: hypothetical protein ABSA66_15635 [Roseiarcus sp.]|jgi:hypothetical protein